MYHTKRQNQDFGNKDILFPMFSITPRGVPECFTPTTQQGCMGLDAIIRGGGV
jgi:hypothetical protein